MQNNQLGSTTCAACKQYVPANQIPLPFVMCSKCQAMSEEKLIAMMRKQPTTKQFSGAMWLVLEYLVEQGEWYTNCGWAVNSPADTRAICLHLSNQGYAERVPLDAPIWDRPEIKFRYRPTAQGREALEKHVSA